MLLVTVCIARTRCEMWRGEGEDGHEDLSSDEDHAVTPSCDGSIALSRERQGENRRAVLATQELDPPPGSGFMLLFLTFMPEHLSSRLAFALLFVLLLVLSQILQHFLNAALVIKHNQQCHCIRSEHIFQAPQEEGPHGLCDKSQDAVFKAGIEEALGDFKLNECLDNRALLPPLPPLPSSSSKSQGCLLTNNPRRQQDGAPGHCGHENAHQETGCVGGGGKGCTVWDRLRPSFPRPALNIFSVSHSVGHPTPNCLG